MDTHLRPIVLVVLTAVVIGIGGCATTRIHSQVYPQRPRRVYQKVMVVVTFQDLGLRQDAERRFQSSLSATEVVRSVDVFFPGRTYSAEEAVLILQSRGIEAMLTASSSDIGTSSTWIPPTTTTEGSATLIGKTVSGSSTTTTSGGVYINKPWAEFDATLRDVDTGDIVWIASMSSDGNAFAGWDDLARSMADKASNQLREDGVVR